MLISAQRGTFKKQEAFVSAMGEIISTRLAENGKVILEVHLPYDEALKLRGHMDGVHIFAGSHAEAKSKISSRGRGVGTTYLLIPRDIRERLAGRVSSPDANCEMVENAASVYLIFQFEKGRPFTKSAGELPRQRRKR